MKCLRFHKSVSRELGDLDLVVREEILDLLTLVASGVSVQFPASRPMPEVMLGAHELRIRERKGSYRIFYFTKRKEAILVFHFFQKKTQQTPLCEIVTARRRLKEMLI